MFIHKDEPKILRLSNHINVEQPCFGFCLHVCRQAGCNGWTAWPQREISAISHPQGHNDASPVR